MHVKREIFPKPTLIKLPLAPGVMATSNRKSTPAVRSPPPYPPVPQTFPSSSPFSCAPLTTALNRIRILEAQVNSNKTTIHALKAQNRQNQQYINCLEKRLADLRDDLGKSSSSSSPHESFFTNALPSTELSICIPPDDGDIVVVSKSAVEVIAKTFGLRSGTSNGMNAPMCGGDSTSEANDSSQLSNVTSQTNTMPRTDVASSPPSSAGLPTPASSYSNGVRTPASSSDWEAAFFPTPTPALSNTAESGEATTPLAMSEHCCECGQYIRHVFVRQPSAYRLCAECEMGRSMVDEFPLVGVPAQADEAGPCSSSYKSEHLPVSWGKSAIRRY
ncbi:hypothetical protein QC763_403179 [Podospora pseudopauciseta]|uniref:ZZ-type domain-containing protein n=1 Tax=Podospora pseudopauciseta TaxID=2093780 RepID=A0ABR0HCK9_9PEZI|nr:hypothetical protein QC763_403179 [Podospora pseudopauciseta]